MDRRYMTKQYICKVRGRHGVFSVFTSGDPKWLLFKTMLPDGQAFGGLEFPVRRADLRRNWRVQCSVV